MYSNNYFVLLGFFNINVNNPSHPLYSNLYNILNSFSLAQVVSEPAHVSPAGSASHDLALISDLFRLSCCSVLPPLGMSDDNGVQLSLMLKNSNLVRSKQREIWRYNLADFETVNSILESFHNTLLNGDINQAWDKWRRAFMSVMEQYIPQATLSWLNVELTISMRARNIAYKCAKRSWKIDYWYAYRNEVANELKCAKTKLFQIS